MQNKIRRHFVAGFYIANTSLAERYHRRHEKVLFHSYFDSISADCLSCRTGGERHRSQQDQRRGTWFSQNRKILNAKNANRQITRIDPGKLAKFATSRYSRSKTAFASSDNEKAIRRADAESEDRALYLAMHNHDSSADQLTGASSDAAEVVQLQNGTEIVITIPVDANKEFVFIPDGYHVMLMGLRQDILVGDDIEVVLHFRDHEDMIISVPVGEAVEHEH